MSDEAKTVDYRVGRKAGIDVSKLFELLVAKCVSRADDFLLLPISSFDLIGMDGEGLEQITEDAAAVDPGLSLLPGSR